MRLITSFSQVLVHDIPKKISTAGLLHWILLETESRLCWTDFTSIN